jgi:hypothetical protein
MQLGSDPPIAIAWIVGANFPYFLNDFCIPEGLSRRLVVERRPRQIHELTSSFYAVGFGKPPRHTQFQKGRSGNPKGRPKGSVNFATGLRRALLATVMVKDNGITRRMTKFDVACRQQSNKAAPRATIDHSS